MTEVLWIVSEPSESFPREIERAVEAALLLAGRAGDVCVRVVNAEEIQSLNRAFRHMDAATDVLTFPAAEGESLLVPPDGYLGDIAICYARAASQAEEFGHPLRRELCFLAVHGALHLCGYDHMNPSEEARMCQKQDEIMQQLGVDR
jgi:probable rRNA maturation factor